MGNSIPTIPVVAYKPSRWEKIKNALEEEGQKESQKSLSDRLQENIESSFYMAKGVGSSIKDTAHFIWDAATSPFETGEKIGEGIKSTYNAVAESSADEKLNWLTHKTIQGLHATPQEKAQAAGYIAGGILIGTGATAGVKGLVKGLSKATQLGILTEEARVVSKLLAKTEKAGSQATSKATQAAEASSGFDKISKGIANIKNGAKVADKILEGDSKALAKDYKKILNGREKPVAPTKPEIIPSHNGYIPEWPNKQYLERMAQAKY